MKYKYYCVLFALLFSLQASAQPLFDTHLHYSEEDTRHYSPQEILNLLDKNNILFAAVTGTPPVHVSKLYQLSPERIVPLLGIYRHHEDKSRWTTDHTLISYLENELKKGFWRGIGELHLFAHQRHSKIVQKVFALASTYHLPLLIHADPAVIDTLYEIAPRQPVVWAHAGTFPYPDLISDYLHRYPHLSIDVSMRDERIAPNGKINDEWYELFVTYPDRFMVGVDTFSTERWQSLSVSVGAIRGWLMQLPNDIAKQIAFTNAEKFYKNRKTTYNDDSFTN